MRIDLIFVRCLVRLVSLQHQYRTYYIMLFNDNVNIGILANKAATARDLLGRLQTAYENFLSGCSKESYHGTKVHWS